MVSNGNTFGVHVIRGDKGGLLEGSKHGTKLQPLQHEPWGGAMLKATKTTFPHLLVDMLEISPLGHLSKKQRRDHHVAKPACALKARVCSKASLPLQV